MTRSNGSIRWRSIVAASGLVLLVGCGSSTGSATPSSPAAQAPGSSAASGGGGAASQPASAPGDAATADPGASGSDGGGPIGGDVGDRTKGSVQAQISGGLTASVDLPFAAALAQLLTQGPGTAYLPFTDPVNGTLFLTISDSGLLVQYAGPNNVGLTNGATPCDLKVDALDAGQAKGTFTCKGMLLIQGNTMGSADMSASFEAHR
jgi:hypothetical protein